MKYLPLTVIVCCLTLIGLVNAQTQTDSRIFLPVLLNQIPMFDYETSAYQFERIIAVDDVDDGRLFVVQRRGVISMVQPDGATSTFLDVSDQVCVAGEHGMYDVAFHPDYAENGYVFVSYTYSTSNCDTDNTNDWRLRVSRFELADANTLDPSSELPIFHIGMTNVIHNGGAILFNPFDGQLYIGLGDDGNSLIAQQDNNAHGKIVRLDVDNLTDGMNGIADALTRAPAQIVAEGFRNPWRFNADPVTGALFIGDVGGSDWEEVNYLPYDATGVAANFGWPCSEGFDSRPQNSGANGCGNADQHAKPIHVYPHEDGNCSITGGVVIRKPFAEHPHFIYSDFCSGTISVLSRANGRWSSTALGDVDTEIFGIVDIHLLDDGRLVTSGHTGTSALYFVTLPNLP